MRASEALAELRKALLAIYDQREAGVIAEWVMEDITGTRRIDRLTHDAPLTEYQQEQWQICKQELQNGRPMQYVLGYTYFLGYRFAVNENVLIPRPETEELVQWLQSDYQPAETVLDIGTGSGCIPVMVQKLTGATVYSIDVSEGALGVAKQNAEALGTPVQFIHANFLDAAEQVTLPTTDIIISNPPYVPIKDKADMHPNVVDHEPHVALFVPDNDALLFYREIVQFAQQRGVKKIYFETHYKLAHAVASLGRDAGYTAEVRKDLAGNERMVAFKASMP